MVVTSQPDSPLPSTRFDMVVDIQPVSRVDLDLPDMATSLSTVVLEKGTVLQFSHNEPVFGRGDNGFRIELEVPPAWAGIVKGGSFHVVVLMPRSPINGWEVQFDADALVSEFANAETFTVDVSSVPGGRSVITWSGTIDDPLPVGWDWIG